MQLDHQHDGEPKILSFERVKDKYFSVLADGNFSTEYPYMTLDRVFRAITASISG